MLLWQTDCVPAYVSIYQRTNSCYGNPFCWIPLVQVREVSGWQEVVIGNPDRESCDLMTAGPIWCCVFPRICNIVTSLTLSCSYLDNGIILLGPRCHAELISVISFMVLMSSMYSFSRCFLILFPHCLPPSHSPFCAVLSADDWWSY